MGGEKSALRAVKSLPSLQQEVVCQNTPDLPELPPLPSPFPVLNTIIVDSCVSGPAWDREVDITFLKDPVEKYVGQHRPQQLPSGVAGNAPADKLSTIAVKNELSNLESRPDTAVLSALDYAGKCRRSRDRTDDKFERAVHILSRSNHRLISKNEWRFLELPANVRRRIWSFVLADEPDKKPRPVRLQPFNPFLKEVWHPTDFQSIKELFANSQGVLAASHAVRAELVAYVLTTHRFHFVFSPFARENVCQQMFHWVEQYSHLMEYMTVELDLSKLCFGATQEASDLIWSNANIVSGLQVWVSIQANKRTAPLENMLLLARRYHGLRPVFGNTVGASSYCPPDAELAVAEGIVKLSGRINTLRVAGFNAVTTNTLITALFPHVDFTDAQGLQNHCSRAGTSTIWPFIPGQPSIHQNGRIPRTPLPPAKTSSAGKISIARKHIARLKNKIEAYEAKRQRNREASIELDNEREIATEQSDKSWASLRGVVRHGGKIYDAEPKVSGQRVKVGTLLSPSPSTDDTPPYDDKEASDISLSTLPSVDREGYIEDNAVTPKAAPRMVTTDELLTRAQGSNETADELKRTSEASSRSLRSKRSIRWSDDTPPHKGYISTQTTAKPQVMRKIQSLPVGGSALEAAQLASPAVRKKDSAKVLSRKKSFVDMLRRHSEAATVGSFESPRFSEPSKSLRNFSVVDLSNKHRRAPM